MAFKEARLTTYREHFAPDGTPTMIVTAGDIFDDTITDESFYTEYRIVGDELRALPPIEPGFVATPEQPVSARAVAVRAILAREAKLAYTEWMRQRALRHPQVIEKSADEIAAIPAITPGELPS